MEKTIYQGLLESDTTTQNIVTEMGYALKSWHQTINLFKPNKM
jgi:hypothetical protein